MVSNIRVLLQYRFAEFFNVMMRVSYDRSSFEYESDEFLFFQGQLTQDWLTVFDLKYINEKMLGGLRRASGKIEDYCEKLAVKAFSLSQVCMHTAVHDKTRNKCTQAPSKQTSKTISGGMYVYRRRTRRKKWNKCTQTPSKQINKMIELHAISPSEESAFVLSSVQARFGWCALLNGGVCCSYTKHASCNC